MSRKRIVYIADTFCQGWEKDFYVVLFTYYDKNLFTVGGYQLGVADDITALFRKSAEFWQDFDGLDAAALKKALRRDSVDLIVDLTAGRYSEALAGLASALKIKYYALTELTCYTPFAAVNEYAVRAPLLDKGEITADVLDGRVLSAAELMTLDIGIYQHTPPVGEVYRAVDLGVPLLICDERGDSRIERLMRALGMERLYVRSASELQAKINALPDMAEQLVALHTRLHWRLWDESVNCPTRYIVELERRYSSVLYARAPLAQAAKRLQRLEQKRDWPALIELATAMDGSGALTAAQYMSVAWAYSFIGDAMRADYWARAAERAGADRVHSQQFLQLKYLRSTQNYLALYDICRRITADDTAPLESRMSAITAQAGVAARLGRPEQNELYLAAVQESTNSYDRLGMFGGYLMCYNSQDVSQKFVYEEHLKYNDFFSEVEGYSHARPRQHKKLRIGYISPDFCSHVMSNFVWPFLASFNRDKFEVYAYTLSKSDQYSETFAGLVTKWRTLDITRQDYAAMAEVIYNDEIDILVDLAGHTANSGLPVLAYRPAPIQVSGLGYMTTTGLKDVDYFFTDKFVDPEGVNDEFFAEKLIRLPSQFCYNDQVSLPESTGTPARRRGYITFGVYNQYTKITDEMLLAWRSIMEQVPGSRLVIKNNVVSTTAVVDMVYERLERLGLDMTRVIFEGATRDYMYRLLDVDIALDTYPYPGGGTTCDSLFMGVPVVSRYSERHSARFSYGILAVVGVPELASPTIEGYIERAVMLARDLDLLDTLHRNLRQMMRASILMQPASYIAAVESEYERIWQEYQTSIAPPRETHPLQILSIITDPICAAVRLYDPSNMMGSRPDVETRISLMETPEAVAAQLAALSPEQRAVVIFERQIFQTVETAEARYRAMVAGRNLVIHDFDDYPAYIPGFAGAGGLEFSGCHAMQTTTPALADFFREYNPNVLVFPNQLKELPAERSYSALNEQVTIFFGALERQSSYLDIMPVLNLLIGVYGARLRFLVTADRRFYDALETTNKEYIGSESMADYADYTGAIGRSDIALLPLRDSEFNRMKSDLKFIEVAANGAVALASPTVYAATIRDGQTGFIYHSPQEFCDRLQLLIDNPVLRIETARRAYRYVRDNRLLVQHYEERLAAYRELLARWPELESARQARIAASMRRLGMV